MAFSITVTRGHTFAADQPFTLADLNAAALPNIQIDGAVGTSDIDNGAINDDKTKPDQHFYAEDSGSSANVYLASPSPSMAALENGAWVYVKIRSAATNTSTTPTLDVNSLGAKTIKRAGGIAVRPGDIRATEVHTFRYNSEGTGYWLLVNPAEPDVRQGTNNSSTADAFALTTTPTVSALYTGLVVRFKVPVANNASATLNVDAMGAKSLRKRGDTALAAGDLALNAEAVVVYDATLNSAAGGWALVSPAMGETVSGPGTAFQIVRTNSGATALENADPVILQVVRKQDATEWSATKTRAVDDNALQQADVDLYTNIAQSFTPKSASSKLLVEFEGFIANPDSDNTPVIVAVFKDSDNALAAGVYWLEATGSNYDRTALARVSVQLDSPGTSAITFKVGLAKENSSTSQIDINTGSGSSNFGGKMYSVLKITEYLP